MIKSQIKEFLTRLRGWEGCNVKGKGENMSWKCDAKSFTLSRKILIKMGISRAKQDAFLEECESYSAFCDCEILFNAAEYLL